MRIGLFFIFVSCFWAKKSAAQSLDCRAAEKNWQALNARALPTQHPFILLRPSPLRFKVYQHLSFPDPLKTAPAAVGVSTVFLPPWSSADLPVFCKIEHDFGKKMPLMVKFRLGSVDYVDWLEGKNRFNAY